MGRIKILHIINTNGGLAKLLLNKLIGLKELGYDIYAIAPEGNYADEIFKSNIKYYPVHINRDICVKDDLRSIYEILDILKKLNIDIVHTHTAKAGIIGRIAAKLAGVPFILHTYHGLPFFKGQSKSIYFTYLTIEKIAALLTKVILSQNRDDLEILGKYKFKKKEYLLYEGSGINIDNIESSLSRERAEKLREQLNLSDKFVIGYFARFEPVKRHSFFLRSLRKVIDVNSKVVCIMAGSGYLEDNIRSEVRRLGLQENVVFLGYRKNILDYLNICEIICLASSKEGIPRILMEAMALKKPVIATNVKGTREVVLDRYNGVIVENGNAEAFSSAILDLLNNDAIRKTLGNNGRKFIEENYDESIVIKRLDNIYKNLIENENLSR
jgi:glycosyltransferase involved in cell wall biosynthesis